jgi:hypothetical protein
VDWIVRKIDQDSTLNFGFYDFFGKINKPIGPDNQIGLSFYHGNTGLHEVAEGTSINSVDKGRFVSDLVHLEWSYLGNSRFSGNSHFYFQQGESDNKNEEGFQLWDFNQRIIGVRSMWNVQVLPRWSVTAGITADYWSVEQTENVFSHALQQWLITDHFDETTTRQELSLENRFLISPRVTLLAGWGWGHQAETVEGIHSPFLGIEARPHPQHAFSLFWGQSGQFPFFNQFFGVLGNENLHPETARNWQGSWIYRPTEEWEIRISGYHRHRDDIPWRLEGLWRLENGQITLPSTAPFDNVLRDRSYGADIRFGRQSPNGLNGWLGYSWGMSHWSQKGGEWFPGNYDQRNGLGLFLYYRWTSEFELSMKLKAASGMPLPAYAEQRNGRYYLAEERNRERLPYYSRFDFRFGKTFNKDRYRITLFVEVLNLAGRENYRYSGHDFDSVNPRSGRIHGLTQKQFPFLPTAGFIVEF